MINNNELLLNNQSYIKKDFESIYKELIDIATKISYRYDPSQSNESDPFIVLLKLLAFTADKVNYNSDKELLERFILSATQEESIQDITFRLGYNMHYYVAAQTNVTIKYNGDSDNLKTFPKFTLFGTVLDGINYISTQDAVFDIYSGSVNVPVLQCSGSIKTLSLISENNTDSKITLTNLDSNKRIYFPESMVAQNGVFIEGGSSYSEVTKLLDNTSGWRLSENLNQEYYGSLVYKFGYNSFKKLPYIEFPDWIDKTIGDGLTIKYIVCNGQQGNVSAKIINSISDIPDKNDLKYYTNDDDLNDFTITNLSSAMNGKDPETIDEAYQGFKKTIATFDTLVTCRDYANAIYKMLNDSGNNYISNVQVSDRRTDINYSRNIIEYTENETQIVSEVDSLTPPVFESNKYYSIDDKGAITPLGTKPTNWTTNYYNYYTKNANDKYIQIKKEQPNINAYDLCLYPLQPVQNLSFETLNYSKGYENTFKLCSNNTLTSIKENLEDNKYITHNYKIFKNGDIILITLNYGLVVTLYTNYKVNSLEAKEILLNVNKALANNFNSRQLDYGYEIPEDLIYNTILNADSRIKSVSLDIKDPTIKALTYDKDIEGGNVINLLEDNKTADWYNNITALNILSGKVDLFEYDERFNFNYLEDQTETFSDVSKITTAPYGFDATNNPFPKQLPDEVSYTLPKNEIIQISSPSLKEGGKVYPYPVKYILQYNSLPTTEELSPGVYKLTGNDFISFTYTKNDIKTTDTYQAGTIIEITGGKLKINSSGQNLPTDFNDSRYKYLTQGMQIGIKEINVVNLQNYIYAYWVTNRPNNELIWRGRGGQAPAWEENTYYSLKTDHTSDLTLDTNYTLTVSQPDNWETNCVSYYTRGAQTTQGAGYHNYIAVAYDHYDHYEYVLNEDEYFFYTNTNNDYLASAEQGTRLKLTLSNADMKEPTLSWANQNNIKISDIIINGLSEIKDKFILQNFTSLSLLEQNILNLSEGDSIKFKTKTAGETVQITPNNFTDLQDNIKEISYRFSDSDTASFTPLSILNLGDDSNTYKHQMRSLLCLNSSPDYAQTLYDDQAVRITYKTSQQTSQVANISRNGMLIQFSTLEQLSGGEDLDLSYVDFINSSNNNEKKYPSLYKYSSVGAIIEPNNTNISFEKTKNKYLIFGINSKTQNPDGSVSILLPKIKNSESTNYKDVYFFCRVDTGIKEKNELCDITIEITGPTGKAIKLVNLNTGESTSAVSSELSLKANTTLNFKFSFPSDSSASDMYYIKITKSKGSSTDDRKVQLSFPRLSEKENPLLGVKFSNEDTNKTMLDYLNSNYKKELKYFYFISYGNPDKRIDISNDYPLSSDKAFYDYDNIANKWVLPKIDFENSTIKIAQTSLIK